MPTSISFYWKDENGKEVELNQGPGHDDFVDDVSRVDFGYEGPQAWNNRTEPGTSRIGRVKRHSVGDGLAPRRGSLTRSDCRGSHDTLTPDLQFSRRNSLGRSDYKSIPVTNESEQENSWHQRTACPTDHGEYNPSPNTARCLPSMAAVINRTSDFVQQDPPKLPRRQGSSRRVLSAAVAMDGCSLKTPSRRITRWNSMGTPKGPAAESSMVKNAAPPRRCNRWE